MSIEAISLNNGGGSYQADSNIIDHGAWLRGSVDTIDHSAWLRGAESSGLHVGNIFSEFKKGFQEGFLVADLEQTFRLLEDAGKPGSDVTIGQMQAKFLEVTVKTNIVKNVGEISQQFGTSVKTLVEKA